MKLQQGNSLQGESFIINSKCVPICHIRFVNKDNKIYLVETQSDLIQRKSRLDEFMPSMNALEGTMLEMNKIYLEELFKIDTFDLALGILKQQYPDCQILTTSEATQCMIEGWGYYHGGSKVRPNTSLDKKQYFKYG